MLPGPSDEDRQQEFGRQQRSHYTGVASFAVTLSPDGKSLYAVNAGANSIAVIPLNGEGAHKVKGLIPTAYEPHDVTFSADGSWMYIVNGKSVTGPNPAHLTSSTALITSITYPGGNAAAAAAAAGSNQYQFQLERASLASAAVPTTADLQALTARVAQNDFYSAESAEDAQVMRFLRDRIKHVTSRKIARSTSLLGDLNNGSNGNPGLTAEHICSSLSAIGDAGRTVIFWGGQSSGRAGLGGEPSSSGRQYGCGSRVRRDVLCSAGGD